MLKASRIVVFLCVICSAAFAQQANILSTVPSANYGSDSINLQTLQPIINVPIRSKGGPVPISSSVVQTPNCFNDPSTGHWKCLNGAIVPTTYGLLFQLTSTSPSGPIVSCGSGLTSGQMTGWYIGDATGNTWHPLSPSLVVYSQECPVTVTGTAIDGSGLTAQITTSWNSVTSVMSISATVTDKFGNVASIPSSTLTTSVPNTVISTSWTDPFSNAISGTSILVDPLNPTGYALKNVSGGLGYVDATGTARTITENYGSSQTLKTALGCSITEESGSSTWLDSFGYPDGTSESFGYESVQSGTITGRINSITLRTGGTISYSYGPMNCTYHKPLTFSRTGADGITSFSVSVSGSNHASTTTVTDPGGNQTVYSFTGYPTSFSVGPSTTNIPVLTQVKVYQNTGTVASPVQTLLTTDLICYNGNTTSCPTAAVSFPITEKQVTHTINGMSSSSKTVTFIDGGPTGGCAGGTAPCYGNVTEVDAYDFGASSPTQKTVLAYGSWTSGNSCSSIGSGVFGKPCYVETDMGSNAVARSEFQYNGFGAITKSLSLTGGSTYLTTTYSPNSNGTVASVVPPNGATITYSYSTSTGCPSSGSGLLPTSVTAGGLTTSTSYECNGGTVTGTTDPNSNASTVAFNDPLFRLSSAADPYSFTVTPSYASTSVSSTSSTFNSGNSELISNAVVDTFGRPITSQVGQGPSSSNYDTVSTSYNTLSGNLWTVPNRTVNTSSPCTATSGSPCTSFPHAVQFDPLGRPINGTTTGAETVATTYAQNDVLTVLSPHPTGENNKQTESQYDGLGRLTWTCDISSTVSGNTACGPNPIAAVNGILTSISYSSAAGSQTVTSTRGSQSHTATSDALGRITSDSFPESGARNYTYDATATATCTWTSTPYLGGNLALEKDALGNNLCYSYDALGRVVQVNANGTSCRHYYYDNSTGYSGTIPTGISLANNLGQMVEAATDTCAANTLITDEWFSYDKDGRMTDLWESTPHSGGYFHTSVTYWPNGALASLSGLPGYTTITYGVDGEGRSNSAVQQNSPTPETLVSSVTFDNVDSPLVVTLGTGDSDTYTYDGKENMTGYSYSVGGTTDAGTLTWNANNTLGSLAITDGFNSGGTQTCNFAYDDVARLGTDNCGTPWSQTFSYDQYDNLSQSGSSNFACTGCYNSANNQYQTLGATYDSDGHLTYDTYYYYWWNEFGKMSKMNSSSTVTCGTTGICLWYDAFGRVVEKTLNAGYYQFIFSPAGRVGLSASSLSALVYAAIPLPGGSLAFSTSSTAHGYEHKDWIGSARLQSSLENSSIYFDRAFAPYGEIYENFGASGLSYQTDFAGLSQLVFNQNGILDTPNRFFMGTQGRWLSPDPARSGWNQYAYPSNPNSSTDPSGLCDWQGSAEDCDTGFNAEVSTEWQSGPLSGFCGGMIDGCVLGVYLGSINGIQSYSQFEGAQPSISDVPGNISMPSGGASSSWGLSGASSSWSDWSAFLQGWNAAASLGQLPTPHDTYIKGPAGVTCPPPTCMEGYIFTPAKNQVLDLIGQPGDFVNPGGLKYTKGTFFDYNAYYNWQSAGNGKFRGGHFVEELYAMASGENYGRFRGMPDNLRDVANNMLHEWQTVGGRSIQNIIIGDTEMTRWFNSVSSKMGYGDYALNPGRIGYYMQYGLYW